MEHACDDLINMVRAFPLDDVDADHVALDKSATKLRGTINPKTCNLGGLYQKWAIYKL